MTLWEVILIGVSLSMDAFAVSVADAMVLKQDKSIAGASWGEAYRGAVIALTFGVFQAVMPMAGYALVALCGHLGQAVYNALQVGGHWAAMGVLCLLGVKMIVEGIRNGQIAPVTSRLDTHPQATSVVGECRPIGAVYRTMVGEVPPIGRMYRTMNKLTPITLLAQGIATSIDALAVGISLGATDGGISKAAALSAVSRGIVLPAIIIGVTTTVICLPAVYLGRRAERLLGPWTTVAGGAVLAAIGVKLGIAG